MLILLCVGAAACNDDVTQFIFEARILEALGYRETPPFGELYDTMLVVVGRGTSVAGANAEAAKLTRIVCENLGFGWSETVYSGVTFPSVGRGLDMALRLAGRVCDETTSKALQLMIEYDPQPPHDAGALHKVDPTVLARVQELAKDKH